MDNQIHFEQTPYHHVYLKDRKTLELTGIKKIESFDSLEFLIDYQCLLLLNQSFQPLNQDNLRLPFVRL